MLGSAVSLRLVGFVGAGWNGHDPSIDWANYEILRITKSFEL